MKQFIYLTTLLMLLSMPLHAEQKQTLGPWDVHYLAFNATFLTPEIARSYGIERSRFTAIINVSVLDKQDQAAQQVTVEGNARNLLGQNRPLSFKRVQDGDAIYYFAPLTIRNEDLWRFQITIRQGNEQQQLRFEQTFYVD
ncbi:DUF4426 domain-containing protein [Alkalimonas collagenimarina]|uniref:DUF4426 domain-containing protein n=1 Tax=Alkalimonas collagenimarina TaxID=400390 RepID=A0ABT9GU93_9GAMM|nr:DUF4426 domain-containing protein [Alkalimonas collagenimarina]MDP4534621.1 DUF4426 domain-containing protein [Alkalimonas collagenimarina]